MDYTLLTDEEVTYELALRHVVNLGPTTHRGKVIRLKAVIQEESLRDFKPTSSDHVMSPQSNIELCESQVQQLHLSTESAIHTADSAALNQIITRLNHYRDRLRLIRCTGELRDTHALLTMHVEVLLRKVKKSSVVNDVQDENTVNQSRPTGAIRRTISEVDEAVGGKEDSTIPLDGNQSQETTPTPVPQPLMASFSDGQGRGWRPLSSFEARDDDDRRQADTGRGSNSPPPPYIPRGPGRGSLLTSSFNVRDENYRKHTDSDGWNNSLPPPYISSRDERGYHPAREEAVSEARWLEERIREVQDREERNREEFCRMRNELERLIRRERPTPERGEERRMQKAVHNWPFKFRGEKDTTSLNVFLDRVETFARSEGMSDAMLLSSIKHLLQEDAIDWYARATSQRLLHTWNDFKREIRREFLPSGYSQILRLEASFRYQGKDETFAKYYRDIAALFRFVEPPIPDDEKFFVVKKNMNENYAAIVTAARPRTLEEMVEVCTGYDETRMLHNRQRRILIPHSALLEPSFATPVTTNRPMPVPQQQQPYRVNRVHSVEVEGFPESEAGEEDVEDKWQHSIDELVEQVNALKMNLESKTVRPNFTMHKEPQHRFANRFNRLGMEQQHSREADQSFVQHQQSQVMHSQPRQSQQQIVQSRVQGWQPRRWTQTAMEESNGNNQRSNRSQQAPERQKEIQYEERQLNNQRSSIVCWNCDEEGHRFMDCPKPQAILFCYRCGRKGYSLRSCFTCRTDTSNYPAENQL
ncbi:uncharacterized protein LOC131678887 [Topomyia yanbarensis]|uniref:uncharacterized protein LOC131678887 n=1 Tax=Topomyia yanbarensis TaxID=2498891 RepID=UPI00273C38CA|nr:uncharacterized protein LOC131678887 [Topomyia yanbarensis]